MPFLSNASLSLLFGLLSALSAPSVFASQVYSLDPNEVPVLRTGNSPSIDLDVQRMAFDMANASCDDLLALPDDTKRIFLLASMFLQREGSLSRIVGPDCAFLGDVVKIAAIDDNALTIGNDREILYHLPQYDVLLVSNEKQNSIAYGIFMDEGTTVDPLNYFLDNRSSAEQSAVIARTFHDTVGAIEPPTYVPTKAVSSARTQAVQTSSAPASARVRSIPSLSSQKTSALSTMSANDIVPTTEFPPNAGSQTTSAAAIAGTTNQATSSQDTLYAGEPSDNLPTVQPLGPEPQPAGLSNGRGPGYWILMIFLALVLVGVAVVVIKTRVSKKQGYIDS